MTTHPDPSHDDIVSHPAFAALSPEAREGIAASAPSGRIARDIRITTDLNTVDLIALRASFDADTPDHIRKAATDELARRGYATWHVHD